MSGSGQESKDTFFRDRASSLHAVCSKNPSFFSFFVAVCSTLSWQKQKYKTLLVFRPLLVVPGPLKQSWLMSTTYFCPSLL